MVLLGQHLGGRHQRGLVPAVDPGEHRGHRDQGLAGADVALQEAVHRHPPLEVTQDLVDRPFLGTGEGERQAFSQPTDAGAVDPVDHTDLGRLDRPLTEHEGELHTEQLVEHQTTTGRHRLGHRLGGVDARHRPHPVDEVVAVEERHRHRVGQRPSLGRLDAAQGLGHEAGDVGRVEAGLLRLRVDRDDAAGLVADQIDDRARHLELAPERRHLAEHDGLAPFRELAFPPALVEERQLEGARPIGDPDIDQHPIAPDPT